MDVHMAVDMYVADKEADMAADKKNWGYPIWQEEEKREPILVRELVTGVG